MVFLFIVCSIMSHLLFLHYYNAVFDSTICKIERSAKVYMFCFLLFTRRTFTFMAELFRSGAGRRTSGSISAKLA